MLKCETEFLSYCAFYEYSDAHGLYTPEKDANFVKLGKRCPASQGYPKWKHRSDILPFALPFSTHMVTRISEFTWTVTGLRSFSLFLDQ